MNKIIKIVLWMLSVLSYIGIILCYPRLPEKIPTHWNFRWEIDGWSDKKIILILGLLPLIILFSYAHFFKSKNKFENNTKLAKVYNLLKVVLAIFFIILDWITIATAFGYDIRMKALFPAVMGILFILLGNYMPVLKGNYFMGIRNRWTMSNDTVWRRVHKIGGYLFIVIGFLMMIMGFLQSDAVNLIIFDLLIIGIVGLNVYSYIFYRKINGNMNNRT